MFSQAQILTFFSTNCTAKPYIWVISENKRSSDNISLWQSQGPRHISYYSQIDTLYHVRRSTKENNSLIILDLILYIIILMIVLITDMIMSKVEIPKGRRIIFASSAPHLGWITFLTRMKVLWGYSNAFSEWVSDSLVSCPDNKEILHRNVLLSLAIPS